MLLLSPSKTVRTLCKFELFSRPCLPYTFLSAPKSPLSPEDILPVLTQRRVVLSLPDVFSVDIEMLLFRYPRQSVPFVNYLAVVSSLHLPVSAEIPSFTRRHPSCPLAVLCRFLLTSKSPFLASRCHISLKQPLVHSVSPLHFFVDASIPSRRCFFYFRLLIFDILLSFFRKFDSRILSFGKRNWG